jgi:hypothetical protein
MTIVTYTSHALRDRLSAFGTSVEGSSLYLLRAIDETVDSLQTEEKLAIATVENAEKMTREVQAASITPGVYIDPEDTAINGIESAYRALEEHLPKMIAKKASIDNDRDLNTDQSELLHIAYERCIETLAMLIEAMKNLRAAVISHDLAAEGRPTQYFDSPKELVDSLHSS